MTIQLNGEPHDVPEPISVSRLLETIDIDPRRVAVEHNRLVVKKAAYGSDRRLRGRRGRGRQLRRRRLAWTLPSQSPGARSARAS